MIPRKSRGNLVLLDACCVLNLYASGRMDQILSSLRWDFGVAKYVVEKEALYIEEEKDREGRPVQQPVDLTPFLKRNLLSVLDLEDDEDRVEFIRFAHRLDDGEAHTCALAVRRGASVATDDKKVIRLLSSRHPPVKVHRTSEILYQWASKARPPEAEVRELLRRITDRARFFPSESDPKYRWWKRLAVKV